jgi:predicted Zn-dependent peptidase
MTSSLLDAAPAQSHSAPVTHRLPNGLTIVAQQMPVEAVSLNLWLNVGSALEPDAINGMAHFLEHMIFKGTAQLQSGEFERRIEERGAVTNAATSQDYTHYYITTAPADFAALAPLQIEVVMNPSIPDAAFERERSVVLEEIRRSQDNPRRRTFQHTAEISFDRLPYRRQVLGTTEVIENLTAQQMRDFHAHWYQPQSVTAVVVGNLPVEQLIEIVSNGFQQALATKPQPVDRDATALMPAAASFMPELPFTTIVRREQMDETLQQARLVMTWRVPGLNELAETYALDMLAWILAQGRTARLIQDLREQRGLVSSVSASNMTFQHQGVFYISAQLPVEHLPTVEAAIVQHIHTLHTERITPAEIDRVRTRVANQFIFGNETPSDRSGLYGYYQSLLGDLSTALNYPAQIQALDAATLQQAAQKYLNPTAYGIVTITPN